ncbi:hypothetical protein Ppa06_48910 [Planomonospora parontospora subsp. parontospora]|uniref:t-SNARE coiled-coil homology domain-containing protein n=2 Tax=Planomonospora parontospora TaxID=58119 RepID=A0AA37BNS6_9ACTN|nr:hypothetical protein [Planomonospora parontospora]GGK94634.1 hypothetical protein GCM10010126_62560 [Planomonospora parontospora]GII11093.1 hypothetical protein Ppa06_48910 [Planomonospora parontospora subsp. parontospora]
MTTTPTIEERVTHLERDIMEFGMRCRQRSLQHAHQAVDPAYGMIEEMHHRLVGVEQAVGRTRDDVKILGEQIGGAIGRMDRVERRFDLLLGQVYDLDKRLTDRMDGLDKRIDGLDKRIDGLDKRLSGRIDELDERLSGRIDELSAQVGELNGRVDALAKSNAAMFQAILERLPEKREPARP